MGLLELFILAVGLSMDAFAVSVCKGLSVTKMEPKHALLCGAYFGGFQALMPALGRSEEHTSELQSHNDIVCRLLLEKKKKIIKRILIKSKK